MQNLSESFIIRHKKQLQPYALLKNTHISDVLKDRVKAIFNISDNDVDFDVAEDQDLQGGF